jgi:hypothetical protein
MLLFNMDRNSNLVVTLFTIPDIYCSSCHDNLTKHAVSTRETLRRQYVACLNGYRYPIPRTLEKTVTLYPRDRLHSKYVHVYRLQRIYLWLCDLSNIDSPELANKRNQAIRKRNGHVFRHRNHRHRKAVNHPCE